MALYWNLLMATRWIRQITFGGAGAWMFWEAAQSYLRAGLVADTAFPAGIGVLMMVLAITAKGG